MVSDMQKVLIIAEAGVNHNGKLEAAMALIDAAAAAGADCVKFQTFRAEKLVTAQTKLADYQAEQLQGAHDTQLKMLQQLELHLDWHQQLKKYANEKGILFASTGFDEESINFLDQLGVPFFKIPSGEITNLPMLQLIAGKKQPVILSTGMASLQEVKDAVAVMLQYGLQREQITVLHCNTEYPTPMQDVNLIAMVQMLKELDLKVGYSDHTLGIEVPVAAVALGASVIEKHITLDRSLPGPDQAASLEPDEFAMMVTAIRNISSAISGTGQKHPSPSEIKNLKAARKSIHLASDLTKNHILSEADLVMKRPGDGISPMQMEQVIGKKLKENFPADHQLQFKDLY
jgi:N-acetylneuraminate synthase/N,N'-diacetyllegionaminate synthase